MDKIEKYWKLDKIGENWKIGQNHTKLKGKNWTNSKIGLSWKIVKSWKSMLKIFWRKSSKLTCSSFSKTEFLNTNSCFTSVCCLFGVCPLLLDRSLYYLKSKVGVRLNPPWPHSLFSSLFGMGKIHKRGQKELKK